MQDQLEMKIKGRLKKSAIYVEDGAREITIRILTEPTEGQRNENN